MVAIPLASKSDPARSTQVNGELLRNCYAEIAPEGSETKFAIYRSPGLSQFYVGSSALSRGIFSLINVDGVDTLLSLHGTALLQIDSAGEPENMGSVFGSGDVYFARNMKATPQVAIVVPGEAGYILESGSVTEITDEDLPSTLNSVGFLNGYFLFGVDDGRFFGSSINEGSSIDALDFATAEGNPDGLVRLFVHASQVFLFGSSSIEIWVYDEREDFPFVRLKGAVIPLGIAGRSAVNEVSGRLYFVDNFGIVRRLDNGYTPTRISNVGVETDIHEAIQAGESIHVWGYLDGGHEFVVVGSTNFTWVFDNVLGVWHNRQTYRYSRWQARHYAYCFGKHLVASDISGGIFELDKTAHDEDGQDLIWTVRTPLVSTFPNGASIPELSLLLETGAAPGGSASEEDSNPQIMMRVTKDGYKTWSAERWKSLGAEGDYRKRVRWHRLGSCGQNGVAFEFSASAACAVSIIQADIGQPQKRTA